MEAERPDRAPEQPEKKDKKKAKDKAVDFYRRIIRGENKGMPPETNDRARGLFRRISDRLFQVDEVKPGDTPESEASKATPETDRAATLPGERTSDFPSFTEHSTETDRLIAQSAESPNIEPADTPSIGETKNTEPNIAAPRMEMIDQVNPAPEHPQPEAQAPNPTHNAPERQGPRPADREPYVAMPLAEQEELYRRQIEADQPSRQYSSADFGSATVYERAQTTSRETPKTERIIESNRGAAVALGTGIVLDQFSRKRHRSHEREFESLKHADKEVAKEVKNDKSAIQRLESQQATNQDNIISLNESRRVQYQNTDINRVEKMQSAPRVETISGEQHPINQEIQVNERTVNAAEVARVRPEVVQKKVEAAAEKNVPIEAYYERRHEVKDNQLGGQGRGASGNVAAVGSLLHSRSQHDDKLAAAMQQAMRTTDHSLHPMQYGTYRKAVARGAVGAGLVLALLGLMLLLG